jgi:hypothetical protein
MARQPRNDFSFPVVSFHEQALGAHTFINRARTATDVVRGYVLLMEILQAFSAAPVLPFDATQHHASTSCKASVSGWRRWTCALLRSPFHAA